MIVLDTNVVSELMHARPNAEVRAWVNARPARDLAITAVTAAELLFGVARLPDGKRKRDLARSVAAVIEEDFAERVLAFDSTCIHHYAEICAARERTGRPISTPDAQIAAVCRVRGAAVSTRNADDFADTGIEVVDPWTTARARGSVG